MSDEQTPGSTAVESTPVQQNPGGSSGVTDTEGGNPAPAAAPAVAAATPSAMPQTPNSDPTEPLATSQPDVRGGAYAGGPVEPQLQTGTNPTNPQSGVTDKMPLVANKPLVDTNAITRDNLPAAHPFVHRLLATARAFGQDAAGGPTYQTSIDPATGATVRTEKPLSGKQIGWAIALEAITGGLAGAGEHGPNAIGAAAAKGLEQGQKIAQGREQTQETADVKAQQDYIRKFEAFKTNLAIYQSQQAIGKHDYDMANQPVETWAGAMKNWRENDPGHIVNQDVSADEAMKADHTKVFAVPTVTIPMADPNDPSKQLYQDIHGKQVPQGTPWSHAVWDHRYALIDASADVPTHDADGNIDPGLQGQIDYGVQPPTMANAGQGTKMPANVYGQGNATVSQIGATDTLFNGKNGVIARANHYRQLVQESEGHAGPNAFDVNAGGATDSIWALYHGNVSNLADFIQSREGTTLPNGSPTRSVRDNNPGNLVADASWTGRVDDKNLPPGQKPFRIYDTEKQGKDALEDQLLKWQKENPNQSINDFFKRYTTPGVVGKDGLNDQQRYIKAALADQGAQDIATIGTDQVPQLNVQQFIHDNPGSIPAMKELQRQLGRKGNTGLDEAIGNMRDSRQKALIVKMLGNDPQVAKDYDADRHNAATAVMEQTRNQAKLAYNDQKRQQDEDAILKRNENTINAIVNGSDVDLRSVLTMRAYDREIVTNELYKRTNGQYSAASIQNMIKLNSEVNDANTKGSFGNKVQNYNTAFQHTSAANEALNQLQSLVPGLAQNTSILNGTMADASKYFEGISPQASAAFVNYRTALDTAAHDWQNAVNNGFALHEEQEKAARDLTSPTASFGNAHAGLNAMMRTIGPRIGPLNEQYQSTMSTPTEKVNYPNMINGATVGALNRLNDIPTMQSVARYESGGTITGGPRGVGTAGKQVGLMLTPAAPQQGAKPTPDVYKRYTDVYGKFEPDGTTSSYQTIKKALAKNGWDVSNLK